MTDGELQIIELAKQPLHYGKLASADIVQIGANMSCGDQVTIYLKLEGDKIMTAQFESTGCSINKASASLLCDYLIGRSLEQAQGITVGQVEELLGVSLSPSRLKCALLPLETVKQAIQEVKSKR